MMLITLLTIGACALPADVTPEQAHGIAIAFLQRAERGIGTQNPVPESELQRSFDSLMNCFVFLGKTGSAYVNKRSGKVRLGGVSVPFGRSQWPENAISESTARQLAQEYFAAAGFSESLYTHLVNRRNEAPPLYQLHCSPKHNDIPFAMAHHVEFHIDAATGKLRMFGASRDWPLPPLDSTAQITAEQARASMAQAIFTMNPASVNALAGPRRTTAIEEFFSLRLNIWLPDVEYPASWPLAEHIADAQAGRGRLVYTAGFQDIDEPLVEDGVHGRRFYAYVDAISGRTLCVYLAVPFGGSGESTSKARSLEVKPCTLDIIIGGKSTRVGTVTISEAEPPEKLGRARPLILRVGKQLLNLSFFPEVGLLATKDENPIYGRPDARLLGVLKRLAASSKQELVARARPR